MAQHKKHPVFLRIKTSNNSVVCINPLQLYSFQIVEKAKVKIKDDTAPEGFKIIEADTVLFYFPVGTGISYSVGVDGFTQDEFNYVSVTLSEYLYLNEYEFRAKSEELDARKMKDWNDKMAEPAVDAVEPAEPTA